ncbi:PD-(D/E)XK nuclease-like domain-containing protein [Glycomyces tenuis]|uniref:PD-(D/E)XK nuclease-like domain-containing protein n=1 Tax=Glycomyces tenuis TaxID=58116 RepID=UPI000427E8DC|nr:PD-(D/E)XK nuclease-like domain-containing protein [Glycomyces tenuis]
MSGEFTVTSPGVYDIPEDVYHADPVPDGSLSSTGARAILPPGTPAKFHWEQAHRTHKTVWDIGTAAHALVLGTGPEIVIIDADSYRTKDAKEKRDSAYGDGKVPLLIDEYEDVLSMVQTINRHPVAGPLLAAGTGLPEQSLFWVDETTSVWCRARLDWIKPAPDGGRLIVADVKTTTAADIASIEKAIANFGYHQQLAFYLDGVRALGLHPDPAAVLVFVEKASPHLVHVVQLDGYTLRLGELKNRRALETFAACAESGTWPGYPTDITTVSLPAWAERTESEEYLTA